MKTRRRKIFHIVMRAIGVALALFVLVKLVGHFTEKKVDVSEGITIIKEQEKQDVQAVENKIQKMEDEQQAEEQEKAERTLKQIFVNSVVMGDSITDAFKDYDVLDESSVVSKIGVSVTGIEDEIATVEQMNPDAIFLSYGMNDIINTNGDPELFKEQYAAVIDELKEALPNSRIFVNSIFPVQSQQIDEKPVYANLPQYNEMLENLCNEEQITYIDNTDLVEDQYYEEDGVHFKADFYPIWAKRMAEVASL